MSKNKNKIASSAKRRQRRQWFQDGFSLISVLVAIGILGIVLSAVMQSLQNNLKAQKKFEELSDMVEIRRVMRARIDCAATKTANGSNWDVCNGSSNIRAVDSAGTTVIAQSAPFSNYGPYILDAKCTKDASNTASIVINVKKGSTVVSSDLFRKVPYTCL